jgi:nicotinamidase-related amidase
MRGKEMATIRNGNKSVFIVVDMQNGVVESAFERNQIINNIQIVLQKARKNKIPIIWVQHSDTELKINSKEWEIVSEFDVKKNEYRINKHFNSCFANTELDDLLKNMDASEIVLAGAETNWCIRATAYGALERGYDLTLISDGHTTKSIDIDKINKIQAKDIIMELNIVMSWISYPNIKNQAIKSSKYLDEKLL